MKKIISIILTASIMAGSTAMPFTTIAADTSANEVQSLEAKEIQVKNMDLNDLNAIQSDPTSVPVKDYEYATLDDVITELCGGEYAGTGSYNIGLGYFMHTGAVTRIFMDKNGKLHNFYVLYPEVVVRMKEGVKLPIDKISNALADKGYKAPKFANEGDTYRLWGNTTKEQFNAMLEMLQKLPDALSVTGHLVVYEDTVNSISGGGGIRIGLPYEMNENNENYKELIKVASSVGYKEGTYESNASIGDYQLFLSKEDVNDRTNPYKLFKYLEDNGYLYSAPVTTTCLAMLNPTVYFCNISYPMNNEAPADLGNDTFNKLRDLTADTFKSVFRYYNIAPLYAFSEYDNIDDALASKYLLSDYYVVEHTDGWFSFYNEELQEYKTTRSTIIDSNEVKLPFTTVNAKALAVYQDEDFASKNISQGVTIGSAYFLSGESSHMGTAVYLKTSAGDYVYYTNYDIGEVLMPLADFCKLQKIIRDEMVKHPDWNDGGSVDLTGIYDLAPYRLKTDAESDEDIDFTKGTKTMNLDDVKEIAQKKAKITWSDFAEFKGEWHGIGMYTHMCRFELEDGYYLLVQGNPPDSPDVIRLYHKDDPDFIDLRYHNVNKYIGEQFLKDLKKMSEGELKAFFSEKGMTEEKGFRAWTMETAPKALDNYYLTFLVKLSASLNDKNGNAIINETTDIKELSKMADDNSFDEQFNNFLGSFVIDICDQFALSGHFIYRSEDSGDAKVYRRYIVISVNGTVGRKFTRDEANQMLASTLNYIQFSPQFAGFVYESKIPLYGVDDTGTLKGDANNDDQVDMADAVLIMQCLANPDKYKLSSEGRANADLDGDGVTVGDAQSIQKRLLNIIDYITDLDTIRNMISDYIADQMIHISVVPKEKMPEQFADKYVFVKWNATHSDGLSYENFLRKNYIDHSLIKTIPYDIDDDSELNKLCEKLYLYVLENNIPVGVYKSKDKVIVQYNWFYKEVREKIETFIKDNSIDPDSVFIDELE